MSRNTFPAGVIRFIQEQGFDVYTRERSPSYAYFSNASGIGYIEHDHASGCSLSSVHKPNRQSGTGYQVARHVGTLTPELLREAVNTHRAPWAHGDDMPVKFASMDAFRNSCEWNKSLTLVETEG